ncbi:MAG: tRNA pseudouridine(38-40) synthase TruA [Hyphomonadaceae bacterium]|nr:tRNA pseudouridine(38-40) synthase TruA [Hyphomonadaceae bacterium]
MPRYKLTIEYDGGPFAGWQRVATGASVQGALEAAAAQLCGERRDVVGAGRTDAGVHAFAQVAHVDLPKPLPGDVVANALNAHLRPHPVSVLRAEPAAEDFHARFDAVRRVYRYRILNRRADAALDRGRVWRVGRDLDAEAMDAAAQALIGQHDFTTFRDSQCQAKSPVKTLDVARVMRLGEEIELAFEARSFLHRQVRSMTGTLAEVGMGKLRVRDVAAALAARDRARCGPVAPAEGLYLVRVDYAAK